MAIELLQNSLKQLDTNHLEVGQLISKACLILKETGGLALEQDHNGPRRGALPAWHIRRITAHIEKNIDSRIMISDLAALVGLGHSHFRRAFKKCFGIGPHAFLMECRIRRAQDLMRTTDHSLSEIAVAAGFADQAHLTTRFRRIVGVTPRAWRWEHGITETTQGRRIRRRSTSPDKSASHYWPVSINRELEPI